MPNVLFVCGRNQWRGPTAEKLFSNKRGIKVSSAGLSPRSPRKLSSSDLVWADVVYVMEQEHKKRILKFFRCNETLPPIHSLDIPDRYKFMDPELVALLQEQLEPLLAKLVEKNR